MDLRSAFILMKRERNTALQFFFCERGADGEPVLILASSEISKRTREAIVDAAQSKKVSEGTMLIDDDGVLQVSPRRTLSGLARAIQEAARKANAVHFTKVQVSGGS